MYNYIYIYIYIYSVAILAQAPFCSVLVSALVRFGYGGAHRLLWCLVFWLTRMTHSRSIAARARRTDRALTLGYVRNRPLDRVHIARYLLPLPHRSRLWRKVSSCMQLMTLLRVALITMLAMLLSPSATRSEIMSFAVPSALIVLLDEQNIMWVL